jgi:hypothetical protein
MARERKRACRFESGFGHIPVDNQNKTYGALPKTYGL